MKFAQLITSARSRDVPKMIKIGSVGSVPHIREIYSYQKCLPFSFFILRHAYSPNGNSQLDHNASIDADFLKEVLFGSVDNCKEIFQGHICPQKLKKIFTIAQA
jgi:hypothetical protein